MEAPKQIRSAQTLDKILRACDALLAQKSFDQISMQEIAAEAGVSVGNLYNRFKDRNALINHVIERRQLVIKETLSLQLGEQELNLQQRLSLLTKVFSETLAPLKHIFVTIAARTNAGIQTDEGAQNNTDEIIEILVDWLMNSVDEITTTHPKEDCTFAIASMAYNLQFDLLLKTPTRMFGNEEFLGLLSRQAYCYLTQPGESQ